jgi:uncharacterized protein YicC (UPF0701 family)
MQKLFYAITILFFSLQSMGQVSKVKNQLERAASDLKKSWESANKSVSEIQKCNLSTTLTDLQFNANKAIAQIEEASSWAKEAESETDGAEGEASSINCSEAKEGAASAEKYFKKAKNSFDDALSGLRMTLEEEDGNTLIDYLNSTLTSIEKGMNNLKKGAEELEKAFNKLGECN